MSYNFTLERLAIVQPEAIPTMASQSLSFRHLRHVSVDDPAAIRPSFRRCRRLIRGSRRCRSERRQPHRGSHVYLAKPLSFEMKALNYSPIPGGVNEILRDGRHDLPIGGRLFSTLLCSLFLGGSLR